MTEEQIPTTEKLAKAMEEAGCPAGMISKARQGYYDDYKSTIATPCMQLVADLSSAGKESLRQRAMNGEFDAQIWESDEWAHSASGKDAMSSLGLSKESLVKLFGVVDA